MQCLTTWHTYNAKLFDITHKSGHITIKILLNIRSRLHGNVVAGNEANMSIQLSFVPILVIFSANNLQATEYSHSNDLHELKC